MNAWATFLYRRKFTEHCKPAIMEKNKNHLKRKTKKKKRKKRKINK